MESASSRFDVLSERIWQLVEAGLMQDAFRLLHGKDHSRILLQMLHKCSEHVPVTFEKSVPKLATLQPSPRAFLLMFLISAISEGQLDAKDETLRTLVQLLGLSQQLLEPLSVKLMSILVERCCDTAQCRESRQEPDVQAGCTTIQSPTEPGEYLCRDLIDNGGHLATFGEFFCTATNVPMP
jgi:hypothetical protein